MRSDDRKSTTGERLVAGLIAAGLCILLIVGLVTGDISSSKYPHLKRASDPAFFWIHMILIATGATGAVLFALGRWRPKPQPDYAARIPRQAAEGFTFLALLGATGAGYFWISEGLAGHETAISRIAGWVAVAMLGLATWPPLLSAGPVRTALRAAGTAAILVAAGMIYPLVR